MGELELAWAAGFFDGEGNISAWKPKGQRLVNLRVRVGQVEPTTLYRFAGAVGVGKIQGPYLRAGNRQPIWYFQCGSAEDVMSVITGLWKFLSEPKRQQARTAIRAFDSSRKSLPSRQAGPTSLEDRMPVVPIEEAREMRAR